MDRPTIVVHGFKTTYEKNKTTGAMDREVDWVHYSPAHAAMYTAIWERVESLRPDPNRIRNDDEGKKIEFLRWRWDMIEKAYKAWKDGHEIPLDGTALGAWPGINEAQAQVLRGVGLKTVEQVATMPDGMISKVQLPNVRDLIKQAQAFLAAHDQNSVANRMNEMERENAAIKEQLAAAMELLEEQSKPKKKAKADDARETA